MTGLLILLGLFFSASVAGIIAEWLGLFKEDKELLKEHNKKNK